MVVVTIINITYCMECMSLKIRLKLFSLASSRILSGQTSRYFNEFFGEKNGPFGIFVFGNVNANLEQGLACIDCCACM
jgi:hypothetical protein